MKKILVLTILLVTLVTGCFALVACNTETSGDFVVGVIQLAPHVALQQANDAFCTKLEELLAADGKKVSFINENAQGEDSNSVSIINTFIGKRVDLIYSIATASSQTAVNMAAEYEIPVIFNAVTDPVDAGLVKSLTAPTGGNVTGVHYEKGNTESVHGCFLRIEMETRDFEHVRLITQSLRNENFKII